MSQFIVTQTEQIFAIKQKNKSKLAAIKIRFWKRLDRVASIERVRKKDILNRLDNKR